MVWAKLRVSCWCLLFSSDFLDPNPSNFSVWKIEESSYVFIVALVLTRTVFTINCNAVDHFEKLDKLFHTEIVSRYTEFQIWRNILCQKWRQIGKHPKTFRSSAILKTNYFFTYSIAHISLTKKQKKLKLCQKVYFNMSFKNK